MNLTISISGCLYQLKHYTCPLALVCDRISNIADAQMRLVPGKQVPIMAFYCREAKTMLASRPRSTAIAIHHISKAGTFYGTRTRNSIFKRNRSEAPYFFSLFKEARVTSHWPVMWHRHSATVNRHCRSCAWVAFEFLHERVPSVSNFSKQWR